MIEWIQLKDEPNRLPPCGKEVMVRLAIYRDEEYLGGVLRLGQRMEETLRGKPLFLVEGFKEPQHSVTCWCELFQ